jgi:hypothetical protein
MLGELHRHGFGVSIARLRPADENPLTADQAYHSFLQEVGLPVATRIVSFPNFLTPGSLADVPFITENCMTKYHTAETRGRFMCHYSKMIIKRSGRMTVTACTLVDDDPNYDLGPSLTESMQVRIMLKHHRCYSCFARGASCSESPL